MYSMESAGWSGGKGSAYPRFLASIFRSAAAAALMVGLSSCSFGPLESVSSLSPAVKADTVGYNDAIGDASDKILLTNILRARDLEPLNLSQLSSLSGALSLQGSLGFTLPWGEGLQQNDLVRGQNSATPSVTASTTPTYTLTPLNTQAFTQTILQPISPSYVLTQWQAGLPREVLLALFVKEIDFPGSDFASTKRYINNPDDSGQLTAFETLIGLLVDAHVELKSVDVLDPVGPNFSLYAAVSSTVTSNLPASGSTPAHTETTTKSNLTDNADSTGFSQITSSADGQYHVGNYDRSGSHGQLYRVYSGQVEVCVDPSKMKDNKLPLPVIDPLPTAQEKNTAKPAPKDNTPSEKPADDKHASDETTPAAQSNGHMVVGAMFTTSLSTGASLGSTGGAGGTGKSGGGGGATGSGSSTSPQGMMAALQAGRVSALVSNKGCQPDEIILHESTEKRFESVSSNFVHVQWRSLSEVFAYLGAILRHSDETKKPYAITLKSDDTIKSDPNQTSDKNAVVFSLTKNGVSDLGIFYGLSNYAVSKPQFFTNTPDYTRSVLSMLSTLVNYSSQSATASSSAPLRLLPIP